MRKQKHYISLVAIAVVAVVFVVSRYSETNHSDESQTIVSEASAAVPQNVAKESLKGLNLRTIAKNVPSGQLIEHKGYISYYNIKYNTPYWVAWELTADETGSNAVNRKGYEFMPDEDLPYENQVNTHDYSNSGYDRGHMCPAGDMKWDADAMHDCFYMSNICPQMPLLNQRYWERLETSCRRWASDNGSVYIVCGPVYSSRKPKSIGREHMIAVPDGFFKVVVTLSKGNEKGIGFYYTNTDQKQTMESALRSIDEIEQLTGYDFFSELPDKQENAIESQKNLRAWN